MKKFTSIGLALVLVSVSLGVFGNYSVKAADWVSRQSSCNGGSSFIYAWSSMGISPPVVASLKIDDEDMPDPANPANGFLGTAVCAGTDKGARTGLQIYYHSADGASDTDDLTGLTTPGGHTITTSSKITVTLTNMGDLAKYFNFALVHGTVSSWKTANLGTATASLTFTISPVRTPAGTGDDFGYCTATPPHCTAAKSDSDYLGAGVDMSMDQSGNTTFRGAYFGLVSAMGGFVQAVRNSDGTQSLVAILGAPHFLADGVTPNVGSLSAFLPNSVLESLFGLPAGGVVTSSLLRATRTDGATTSDAPFTVTPTNGGVIVKLTDITFSSPTYTITKAPEVTSMPEVATTTGSTSTQSSATTKNVATPVTITANKDKSTVRVDGTNIAADGKASYRIVVAVKDKSGTVITDQKPELTADQATKVTITDPVLVGGEWIAYATSTKAGDKTITVKAGGVQLSDAKMTFTAPPVATMSKATTKKVVKEVPPLPAEPADHTTAMALLGAGATILLGGLWFFARSAAGARLLARLRGSTTK